MRVLVVFFLSVLGCSVAEGRIVGKCDLKREFDQSDMPNILTEDRWAEIVCHAELMSGFNTSAVNQNAAGWLLYGLFQLNNTLHCNTTSFHCGVSHQDLLDDIILDDIVCLFSIARCLIANGFQNKSLIEMIVLNYQDECRDKKASEYFAGC